MAQQLPNKALKMVRKLLQNCKKWNDFRVGVSYFWSLEKVCVRVGVRERHYLCE